MRVLIAHLSQSFRVHPHTKTQVPVVALSLSIMLSEPNSSASFAVSSSIGPVSAMWGLGCVA